MQISSTGKHHATAGQRPTKQYRITNSKALTPVTFGGQEQTKATGANHSNRKAIIRAIIASVIGIPIIVGSLLFLAPVLPAIATCVIAFLGVVGLVWAIGVPQMKPDCPDRSEEEASAEARKAKTKA